jgi:hypothetical protein
MILAEIVVVNVMKLFMEKHLNVLNVEIFIYVKNVLLIIKKIINININFIFD